MGKAKNNMKALRTEAGLSQTDLAIAAGFGEKAQGRIGHYETERREPSLSHIHSIIKGFRASGIDCNFDQIWPLN